MLRLILLVFTPLLSLVIVTLGSGLLTTLLTVRLHAEGGGPLIIGIITAVYYAGLVLGSFRTSLLIKRVGHVRVYVGFAAILAVVTMLQGIFVSDTIWIVLRFISGYAIAALYISIESWLLIVVPVAKRGQALSLYMIAFYAALASGQLLLNISAPSTIMPFCIVVMLAALSIVPISMTRTACPNIEDIAALSFFKLYKISPSGVIGCFCGGLITSVIYGLMPLFIKQMHFSDQYVAWVMSLTIFGAMFIQYPIGRVSDKVDRRKVLMLVSFATLLVSLLLGATAYFTQLLFLLMAFIFGGISFTLYPVSISHACDYLESKDIVAAIQGLLLANGIGSIIGPILVPSFISVFGPVGLFIYFGVITGLLGVFFAWRRTQKSATPVAEQQDFVAVPRTTPVATNLDPRAEESS